MLVTQPFEQIGENWSIKSTKLLILESYESNESLQDSTNAPSLLSISSPNKS